MTVVDAIASIQRYTSSGATVARVHITSKMVDELIAMTGRWVECVDEQSSFLGYPVEVSDAFAIVGEVTR